MQELPPSVQTSSRSGTGKAKLLALIAQLRDGFIAEERASGGSGRFARRRAAAEAAGGGDSGGDSKLRDPKPVVVEERWEGADDPWPELRQQEAVRQS